MKLKFQSLLFVLKQSYICYYIICMTVPLTSLYYLYDFNFGKLEGETILYICTWV